MFKVIKDKVSAQFEQMVINSRLANQSLFRVKIDKDVLYSAYINSFPEDEKQEHRCSSCRHFLNNYGGIVTISNDGVKDTLWDFEIGGAFASVPHALNRIVRKSMIDNVFISKFAHLGTNFNMQPIYNEGKLVNTIKWEHFFYQLPKEMVDKNKESIKSIESMWRTKQQVFKRALVLDLIEQDNLYRGFEHTKSLEAFLVHKTAVKDFEPNSLDCSVSDNYWDRKFDFYAWRNLDFTSHIRNESIGTLLVDLSEGKDLEASVKAFEAIKAGPNYKRPMAIVTKAELDKLENYLETNCLTKAIFRRFAVADDIPVNNLIYVNRSTVPTTSVFDEIKETLPVDPKSLKNLQEYTGDEFIQQVLPTVENLEVLIQNNQNNFVSLTAATDKDAPSIFFWGNSIAWAYQDNNADAVKLKIEKAGGNTVGELGIRLSWGCLDDYDLHVIEPNRHHIFYGDKTAHLNNGGLDVDMNVQPYHAVRDAVENVIFVNPNEMLPGIYQVFVHNYRKAENIDYWFNVDIECRGEIFNFSHPGPIANDKYIHVADISWTKADGITNITSFIGDGKPISKEVWGVKTNTFQKVSMILNSPNYWGEEGKGNKHLFFILPNVKNTTNPRGFFNEYLIPELIPFRKATEALANKLTVDTSDDQLSGLGFSSTIRAKLICRVNNSNRLIQINF